VLSNVIRKVKYEHKQRNFSVEYPLYCTTTRATTHATNSVSSVICMYEWQHYRRQLPLRFRWETYSSKPFRV